jgi:hypothetical protein
MKNCRKIHPLLALYRDKGLTPAQEKQVEDHLKTCPQARRELASFDVLLKSMAFLPDPQPPPDLHERIMARIHPGSQTTPTPRFRWRIPALGLVAAACLTLFFLVQTPDIMNPREKLIPAQSGGSSKVMSTQNQPLSELQSTRQKKALPSKRAMHQAESADTYAKEMPASIGSSVLGKDSLALEKPNKSRKKEFNSFSPEANASAMSPSGGNSTASPSLPMAQVPSNFGSSAGADDKSRDLGKKEEAVPASAAAAPEVSPPTPQPTEGAYRSFLFSKEISGSNWSGDNGPSTLANQILITDTETFNTDWIGLRPHEALPGVDFSLQAVVLLWEGDHPCCGASVHVTKLEETNDQIIVHYQVVESSSSPSNPSPIRPWSMQVIPKPVKPVVFQKDP